MYLFLSNLFELTSKNVLAQQWNYPLSILFCIKKAFHNETPLTD